MKNARTQAILGMVAGTVVAGSAGAAVIQVNANIAASTTWTNNNAYRLTQQIYVLPGATLTIEPGVVVASFNADQGSLAVCRGARIFVNGTKENPVIMTSQGDVNTWDVLAGHPLGRDPKTGTWREACNEWGNLTIMGRAYVSNGPGSPQFIAGNSAAPNAGNVLAMEGLVAAFPGDPNVLMGGGDDDDDSGSISYLSLRYGGKVIGLTNELNGLSLGALGRETEIHHVDIMNNVDDGIEIWGGTVNLKYINIWNIGDDSFDVDCGWRGKAQFGLIVQGYSVDAPQGSGVGDNIFEMDGAQDSDCQPVTTTVLYNFTAIGQPVSGAGDHGTAWRANARVQYRNCTIMDLGERLVSFDNVDGDGSQGYGFNGTLGWAATWNTNFNVFSLVNAPANPALFYTAQTSGKLCEIKDSVFYRNLHAAAYTESDARGVTIAGGSNPALNNVVSAHSLVDPNFNLPVRGLTRASAVTKGGTTQIQVTTLDPRSDNAADVSAFTAPDDNFFSPAPFRGAFSHTKNWLCDWTAADAFGFVVTGVSSCNLCEGDPTLNGEVDIDDLLFIINHWGRSGVGPADVNGDLTVNIDDLLLIINQWGNCP